jgi:hypothetical protein
MPDCLIPSQPRRLSIARAEMPRAFFAFNAIAFTDADQHITPGGDR